MKVPFQEKKFFVVITDYGSNHYEANTEVYTSYSDAINHRHNFRTTFTTKDSFILGFTTREEAELEIRSTNK